MKVRALIADDEPLARERLRFQLASDPDIEVVGECRNGDEVVSFLRVQPDFKHIDVLFLDIQMPGRGGFEAIEQIRRALQNEQNNTKQTPIVVFVTAHDQYAIRAFKIHALDYLTKPVEAERLIATLSCVKERIASNHALRNQERLLKVLSDLHSISSSSEPIGGVLTGSQSGDLPESGTPEYPKRLLIPNGQKDAVVNIHEIEWIEAADYYACLHVGAKSFMLRESVKQLANILRPGQFVRIHRSTIVNMDYVREIAREGRSEGAVILTSGLRLRMSKTGWQNLVAASRTR
ncbi:LytR/AlgR family response regulator transcription factor [Tunturiibacter gelidoferens]|jgi:two-component system, LytTR family, response regulator|uniref:Two-component system LytT family response regulator n=1 Tax=Tunturiibacter gelidiferens TaxID=3069689 RepID=A0A9X0QIJ6_9BACT|nr:response regulator transcription factor [Edaphobacter lichenicola]MBB5330889.1 two-component system LytT family response regulator [Edaphobacter lichenicola]